MPPQSCYIKAFAQTYESKRSFSPVYILCLILNPLLIQENIDVYLDVHLFKVFFEDKEYVVTQMQPMQLRTEH